MSRISQDDYFMGIAHMVARRSTCVRRQVGCVALNNSYHIVATGYNGAPRGLSHCTDKPCSGAELPSGQGLDKCQAVHAEANALLQTSNILQVAVIYCTTKPCIHCIKMIMNTTCTELVYDQDYPLDLAGLEPKFRMRQHHVDFTNIFARP
jgi:dCMP deaminase